MPDIQTYNYFRIMKRTLLVSAFTVMALAASAQVSEVTKMKGDGFGFIPKSLTTTGVITPYSTIIGGDRGDGHSTEIKPAEFTVYDASFNVAKTFSYEPKVFKNKVVRMKALADFKTKEVLDKGSEKESFRPVYGVYDYEKGFLVPVTTMDEFKAAIAKMLSGETVDFFTDDSGNFAFHLDDDWLRIVSSSDPITVSESYFYYNSSDNKLYSVKNLTKIVEVDTSSLDWKVDETQESHEYKWAESVHAIEVHDYDANCNEGSHEYLSQNVFNNDDKYEYLVKTYKEVSTTTNSTRSISACPIAGIEDGKIVFVKDVEDKYYEPCLVVKDEDGKDLFSVSTVDYIGDTFTIYRANGKTYFGTEEYLGNSLYQYVIYLIDKTDTSITELARTQAVKSAKTFNMAGMLVGKNAKGIVIQQGGKKYFNK